MLIEKLYRLVFNKLLYIYFTIGLIALDLLSKDYIAKNFQYNEVRVLINNLLNLRYIHNKGAAFSIFSGKPILLLIPAIIFIIIGSYFIMSYKLDKNTKFAISLILAGAAGNAYDRIVFSYVRDFFEFSFVKFAIFNVADIYITIGSIFLILLIFIKPSNYKQV